MLRAWLCVLAAAMCAVALGAGPSGAAIRLVDGFEHASEWRAQPADGVELTLHEDAGVRGRSLRLDFNFVHGGGYAVIHRALSLDLPANYRFRFRVRGNCPPENLEFKLIDASGENVWWQNRRGFHFPAAWDTLTIRKRHLEFAWGPAGGGEIAHVTALEFAVTAGSGGKGSVWLDELELEELPPPSAAPPEPVVTASSSRGADIPARALDGDSTSVWASAPGDGHPWLSLDFGMDRELGGLTLRWAAERPASDYVVEGSQDGASWRPLRTVHEGNGGRDDLWLPETETRHLRVRVLGTPAAGGVALAQLVVRPLEWGATLERFFLGIAKESPRGAFPRAIAGEQNYWTVVGVDGDRAEALLDEDGMLETGKSSFSIEPFLYANGRLLAWSDSRSAVALAGGDLPMPTVRRRHGDLELSVSAFAAGAPGQSRLFARYRVRNAGARRVRGTLYLALRPFQVNPPQQFLNAPGGVAPLRSIERSGRHVRANGTQDIVSLQAPSGFGAATFDQGDITEYLRADRLPLHSQVRDSFEHASAALAYAFDLAPGAEQRVDLLVPLHGLLDDTEQLPSSAAARSFVDAVEAANARQWRAKLSRVDISLPDADVTRTLRAQIGWILVNRDSAGLQPGSRSYERSWIRDGALTSAALLRVGEADVVRAFIEWYATFLYPDGKVPCCVDTRGADPVPELDSGGEFIYIVAEYVRHTGDIAFAQRYWPAVHRAAEWLDGLRHERMTAEYRAPERREFYGLLPPSISHEGYSAKPMHSYWDDFFALRGFQDAAWLARAIGQGEEGVRLDTLHAQFERDLLASIAAAMQRHAIAYIPGCADLGDFDATSTTIALSPGGALHALPRAAVDSTFERYWRFFTDRRDGRTPWEAFTPYEVRTIGAFVRLGWRDRANELVRWFMTTRRPAGWAQWPEVVWHDVRAPHFIGDLPHTWVGSDFVRSVLDMLAYEDDDGTIVVGAGVPWSWVAGEGGVRVKGLSTPAGPLSFRMRSQGELLHAQIEAGLRVPGGGLVVRPPSRAAFRSITVNGAPARLEPDGSARITALPATIVFSP